MAVLGAVFEWPLARTDAERVRRLALAVVFAGVASAAVTFAFQEIFLVWLPYMEGLTQLGQAVLGFKTVGALFKVAWATLLGVARCPVWPRRSGWPC
jgi:hypothetical protein